MESKNQPVDKASDGNVRAEHIHIYPTPQLGQDMTQGQFLSEV